MLPWLVCVLLQPALAGEVYRWVDAEGGVHYTATPPPAGQQAERMRVKTSRAGSSAPDTKAAGSPAKESAAAAPAPEQRAQDDREKEAERQAQCANARSIVERLETRPAALFRRDDGSYQRYSDAEREQMIGDAQDFQRQHCN